MRIRTSSLRLLALSLLCAAGLPARAQYYPPAQPARPGARGIPRAASAVLDAQAVGAAAKGTSAPQRLVAMAVDHGTSIDSTRYYYSSPLRGAAHNPKLPNSYLDVWHPFRALDFQANNETVQYIFCDSVAQFTADTLTPLMSAIDRRYQYNAAGKVTSVRDYYRRQLVGKAAYAYNAAGANTALLQDVDSGLLYGFIPCGRFVPSMYEHVTLNAAGLPAKDSLTSFNVPPFRYITMSFLRTYTAAGLPARTVQMLYDSSGSGLTDSFTRVMFTYNAAGLLQTIYTEAFDATHWYLFQVDSFGYAGTNPSYVYYVQKQLMSTGSPLVLTNRTLAHLNAQGNWDTVSTYQYTSTGWSPYERTVYAYNSELNHSRWFKYYGSATGVGFESTPYDVYRFYYEPFNNLAVAPVAAAAPEVVVYPNPASGSITVVHPAATAYAVVDALGQTIQTGALQPEAHSQLDVRGLPAGVYWIRVQAAAGAVAPARFVLY